MKNRSIDLVGNTPIYQIKNTNIFAKLEMYNLTGSSKDRIVKHILLSAQEQGQLKEASTIIEATSGNTGIGLAAIGKSLGYKVILTMPETMSIERRRLLKLYGAELILTSGELGMAGAVQKAYELSKEVPNSFMVNQFDNPKNPEAHYLTTGPEIWNQMDGKMDYLVAGIGTGGTITGVGRYLKEKNSAIKIIGVEPSSSPILSKGYAGKHQIEGIGAGFVPRILDTSILNEIITVTDEEAMEEARGFAKEEGILVGISSGAALNVAKKISKQNPDKKIVVILPDSGDRYLSVI
ncbi:MAG: cysteine synthase A [Anaeroplasmataceae bacterium]|nr:cysteine synthase A [Anaeroplasmataceae bacterium]